MLLVLAACAPEPPACIVFVGDVSLSRGVAQELARHDGSPWDAFPAGDAWIGNLEGTLAEGTCDKDERLCLGITREDLHRLRGSPFVALSRANNHALDHGEAGYRATDAALRELGIAPIGEEPTYLSAAGLDLALVGLDLSHGDTQATLERARLLLAKARARTPWVVALPHWGIEGVGELGPGQEVTAALLRTWGARLVVGAHAHVPQPSACSADGATWFGLGNHLFDQRPPETHEGTLVRCCPAAGGLTCTETRTRRTADSVLPRPVEGEVSRCTIPDEAVDLSWQVHDMRDRFELVQPFLPAGAGAWLALHRAWSDLDGEVGLRPYVFRVEGDRYVDVWRGSSLARPIVAARLFVEDGETLLCALHRGDSFLAPDPATRVRVHAVYRWNGFGFRAIDDPEARARCEAT